MPVAEVGLSVEVVRMTLGDAMEELLGMQSDGRINGYLELSLVEITWHNYQETCKLRESSDWQEWLNKNDHPSTGVVATASSW